MQRERRGDPLLARALAAEQKLEACEELLKKTAGERYAYKTRVTQLEAHQLSEVRTANAAEFATARLWSGNRASTM